MTDAPHTVTRCTPLDRSCTYLHPRKASGVHRLLVSTVPFLGSPDLWIGLKENGSGILAASGIAEFDPGIKEGILDWIQVSPEFRRQRLGCFVVMELLLRLKKRADFVTVSGRMHNPTNPYALYLNCGFENPVVWHVIRRQSL